MSDPIIQVENLGKKYRLRQQSAERYTAMRDVVASKVRKLLRPGAGKETASSTYNDFWALKDISFEVKPGEVVGIIGRNGAGKSTLLKILSRITEPSKGRITLGGRVASLLEVGTGFHPELTGRENIYLNGAILGMAKTEIRRKFDEIVAFAEVEKFLDTPVKRYSSGMYVRLAFAIAAHLDSEILIVDEVLAVGDASFQKKCLGKMDDVREGGRTVLFVSHDLRNVSRLCTRAILLAGGLVATDGAVDTVVAEYTSALLPSQSGYANLVDHGDRSGTGLARFHDIELLDAASCRTSLFSHGSDMMIRVLLRVDTPVPGAKLAVIIATAEGVAVHDFWNVDDGPTWNGGPGAHTFTVRIPRLRLYPGSYIINLWLGDAQLQRLDYVKQAISFEVGPASTGVPDRPLLTVNGLVAQEAHWQHELRERSAHAEKTEPACAELNNI
jgi:lipopolysaccharide transport system ATP-binding protein